VRAAITIESFRPGPGGVEGVAWQLARELGSRGMDITVLCREAAPQAPAGVRVESLGGPTFWQPLRVLEFSRRVARASATGGFDVVQAFSRTRHQDVYRAGGAATRPTWRASTRTPPAPPLLAAPPLAAGDRGSGVPRRARDDLCNSKLVAGELERAQAGARAPAVIYNGVDLERFTRDCANRAARACAASSGLDGPIALFVGSGFARKDLDRAIAGLAAAGAKADLVVAGAGDPSPFRHQAEALGIGGRVHFLGVRNDVAELYAAADLFVLPTRYDPFANVCLEAMASGVAVATTRRNGAADLIEPGVSGFVCDEDFAPRSRAREPPALRAGRRAPSGRRFGCAGALGAALWERMHARRGAQRQLAAALRSGATPSGVTVLKRNRVRVVARAGDTLLKVLFARPRNAAREARALLRAQRLGIRVPELLGSGPDWIATRFSALRRRADFDLLPLPRRPPRRVSCTATASGTCWSTRPRGLPRPAGRGPPAAVRRPLGSAARLLAQSPSPALARAFLARPPRARTGRAVHAAV
jgi:UDP-glucose:(heptosyl)LPS alpha-1,3-glucosyltransferase